MGNKSKITRGLTTLLASAAFFGAVTTTQAQETKSYGGRGNIEYATDGNDSNNITTTLSVGDAGNYEGRRFGAVAQFFENARVVHVSSDNEDYLTGGARVPTKQEESFVKGLFPYFSLGDRQGIGVEALLGKENVELTLNAETRTNPTDATHLGAGLDYRVNDSLMIGAGFDHVDDEGSSRSQYLVTSELRASPTDSFGLAGVVTNNSNSGTDKGLGAFWIHHGKDESWGVRARARADWNNSSDSKSGEAEIIFAEKPTTGEPGATWIVGRNIRDDEMYHQGLIPIGVHDVVGVPLMDRADEGYSVLVKGKLAESGNTQSGLIKGALAHMNKNNFGRIEEAGAYLGATHSFAENTDNTTTVDAGILVRSKRFTVGSNLSVDAESGNVAGSVNATIKF